MASPVRSAICPMVSSEFLCYMHFSPWPKANFGNYKEEVKPKV